MVGPWAKLAKKISPPGPMNGPERPLPLIVQAIRKKSQPTQAH